MPDTPLSSRVRVREGIYVCGDHRSSATLNGAIASGRSAAAAVLADSLFP